MHFQDCLDSTITYRPAHQSKESKHLNLCHNFFDFIDPFQDQNFRPLIVTKISGAKKFPNSSDTIYPLCSQKVSSRFRDPPHCSERVQHGMELREGISGAQDDSGFSSGPPSWACASTEEDLDVLTKNMRELAQSGCYFGPMDSASARMILKHASLGTFLIRDSSDSKYLYSLSVKTERGATSVRILYRNGLFQFDSDARSRQKLPQFESVMSLLDFHTLFSQDKKNKKWRWEDNSGKKMMNVVLNKPRKSQVSSLLHLSRVTINQNLNNVHLPAVSVDNLYMLPEKLKTYLKDYPYRL